jgi:hypothetical protein
MDENKITISWDDLRTRQVEQRVSAMQAMRRNREYAAITDAAADEPKKFKSLWYNSAVYMSLFGLVGGLLAWVCGTALHFKNSALVEAGEARHRIEEVRVAAQAGKMTKDEKDLALKLIESDYAHNPYLGVYLDESLTDAQKKAAIAKIEDKNRVRAFISNILAFCVSGMLIALALSIADPLVSRNIPSAIINGSVGATLGIVGGVVVAFFAEKMYRSLGGDDGSITTSRMILARAVQWGVVGFFLTLAPGLVMRNGKKLVIGAIGGLIGGAVGGALFDIIRNATDNNKDLGWLVSLCAIGTLAGLFGALVETAARSGWLKVTGGLIAGKQFILYRNPTFIGSSPDNQIYLFKDHNVGRRHAAIHIVKGGFELEDLPLGVATMVNNRPITRARLRSGDQIQVGGTRFVFQEKQPSDLAPKGNGKRH